MKLQPEFMDMFCGDGFQELYDSITVDILDENATFLQPLLDDLMLFCFINTGEEMVTSSQESRLSMPL
jgi:hypothetical protein